MVANGHGCGSRRRRRVGIEEGRSGDGRRQVEVGHAHVVSPRGVVGEGDGVALRVDRGRESPPEDVGQAPQGAVLEPEGVEVGDPVAVGAEHHGPAVGGPGRLDVLGPIVGQQGDRSRGRVHEDDVEPAPGGEARGHDPVTLRPPAGRAPFGSRPGRG